MKLYETGQGRSSLLLAINALAKKDRKYIISQAFTCIAVPEAIINSGYIPFWVDIELKTYSLNIDLVKKTFDLYKDHFAAIIIQHTYGLFPRYYDQLKLLAVQNKIPIIEDRCHCNFVKDYIDLYLSNKKEKIAFCYSFENAKPIKLGRGGLLIISNEDKKESLRLNRMYKKFKNQSILKSSLNILISAFYMIFRHTFLYWPLLEIYRYLARIGILPANFKSYLNDLRYEKIGFFQNLCLKVIIQGSKIYSKNNYNKLFSSFFKNLKIAVKYPIYVKNKKNVIKFCKKRRIPALEYFNTPIQPLTEDDLSIVKYKLYSCPNAEKASAHIIVFDSLPKEKLLKKIKNL